MHHQNRGTTEEKTGSFQLSRFVRMILFLPLIAVFVLWGVRKLEFLATYHPRAYSPGDHWKCPANGEDVWITSASGQRVHGWFFPALGGSSVATVLYCHGNGGDLTDVGWVARELAGRSMDVLIFDYRGYGRSEGKLTNEWGLYADADAAYDYLTSQRGVRPETLVIHGQSLGTTAAIDLASRRPCGALIVQSGLTSASDMGRVALPWLPGWLHFLSANRFESLRKIAQTKCPVFVMHGDHDEVIPVEQGRRLYEAAPDPKRLLILEAGDHNLTNDAARYLDSITNFVMEQMVRRRSSSSSPASRM
jgi:uncharacterized protein